MSIADQINDNLKKNTVVEYSEIQAELAKLQEQYGCVVPDASTKDGYDFSKSAANACRDIRLNLEDVRKEKKQPYLDMSRLIDSQAKEIKSAIESIETPHREAFQEIDRKKKELLESRKQTIYELNHSFDMWNGKTESEIKDQIEFVEDMDMSKESFGRLLEDAVAAQQTAINQLYRAHAEAVNRRVADEQAEADRKELELLRKEAAERAEQDRIKEAKELSKAACEAIETKPKTLIQEAINAEKLNPVDDEFGGIDVQSVMSRLIYALTKNAARNDFSDFLDEWGISEDEYSAVKDLWRSQGIKPYC